MEWHLSVLRNYAEFTGRARRKEYWMFVLFNALFGLATAAVGGALSYSMDTPAFMGLYIIYVCIDCIYSRVGCCCKKTP